MGKGYKTAIYFIIFFVIFMEIIIHLPKEKKESSDWYKTAYALKLDENQELIDYVYNKDYLFAILGDKRNRRYGNAVCIYKSENLSSKVNWIKVSEYDFSKVLPWKVEIGDIDDSENLELFIGVYKSTHFDNKQNNRMFVFNWDGEKLSKKWTGSQIGYCMKNFYVIDFLDMYGDELIILDKNKEGKERILIYYWLDFGFTLLAESENFDLIEKVEYSNDNLLKLTCRNQGKRFQKEVTVRNGEVVGISD